MQALARGPKRGARDELLRRHGPTSNPWAPPPGDATMTSTKNLAVLSKGDARFALVKCVGWNLKDCGARFEGIALDSCRSLALNMHCAVDISVDEGYYS